MKSSSIVISTLLIAWFLGIVMMSLYIRGVYYFETEVYPMLCFWVGAVLLSSSLICLYTCSKNYSYLMALVFISAFFVASLKFMRFYFYGTDLMGEYFVATITQGLNRWPIERISDASLHILVLTPVTSHKFFSCLSVTILPTIITRITGMSMMNVFRIMIPTIAAVVAIIGFLVVREAFSQKIAGLSTIVFIFFYIYLSVYTQMIRQGVALVFFFLTLYFLSKRERKCSLLSILTMFMLATAHYAVIYFIILALFITIASRRLYDLRNVRIFRFFFSTVCSKKEVRHAVLSKQLFMCMVIVGFSWLTFIAYPTFSANLSVPINLFESIIGLRKPQYGFHRQYAVFSSLGILHTIVRWLIQALSIAGFFIALKAYKDKKSFSITIMSGTLLLLLLLWAILPYPSLAFGIERTYAIVLFGFSVFVAITITKFKNKFKNWGIIFSILIIVVMFLDSVGAPILYLPESSTHDPFSHIWKPSDLSFTEWVEPYTDRRSIFASDVRGCIIGVGHAQRRCMLLNVQKSTDIIPLIKNVNFEYFIHIETGGYLGFERSQSLVFLLNSTETNRVYDICELNCVYDNGRISLTSKLQGS